jgi:hypothetical protein
MKFFYKIISAFMGIIHVPIVVVIFFGWIFNGFWSYVYFVTLFLTLCSWVLLGYCLITKWEFDVRKKFMDIPNYHYEYLHYWGYKLLKININPKKIRFYGILFIVVSMIFFIVRMNLWR